MQILKVYLENIKSFEQRTFDFAPGTNAICGPNGAGKTSIIEAIAYALFDYLPYKKDNFVRLGAKKGWVRVTFLSALDGRADRLIVRASDIHESIVSGSRFALCHLRLTALVGELTDPALDVGSDVTSSPCAEIKDR